MSEDALPHPRTFPRALIRSALGAMIAEGKPPAAITVTQLRLRVGGGSWETLREELERAREEHDGVAARTTEQGVADDLPEELAPQVDVVERLLEQAGRELQALIRAVREHDRRQHERELAALRAEIDELRRQLAASPAPRRTDKRRRQSGGDAS
jgi:uncharacterized membrane protein YccC